ncbi:putative small auxin-up RNA [Dioscorea sansibarensis]
MARKRLKVAAFGRRTTSPKTDECSDFNACSTSYVAEKGQFFVCSSEGKWFMVPLAYLDISIFEELLKISEEEFGLPFDGPITLPNDASSMEYVLFLIRRGVSKEMKMVMLS